MSKLMDVNKFSASLESVKVDKNKPAAATAAAGGVLAVEEVKGEDSFGEDSDPE